MASARTGERRIDKKRLAVLVGTGRIQTIARQIAAEDGKTLAGARRQVQRWVGTGPGSQARISERNAARLSDALGVTPDEWSTPVTRDLLEQELAKVMKVAAAARKRAAEIRRLLRDEDIPQ